MEVSSNSGRGVGPIRASQREVKSCVYCYRRKVKCDKVFPCSQCLKRGLGDLCRQETALVNGKLTGGNGATPRSDRRALTMAELMEENKALLRKVTAQEKVIASLSSGEVASSSKPRISAGDSPVMSSRHSTPEQGLEESDDQLGYLAVAHQIYGTVSKSTTPKMIFTQATQQTLESLHLMIPFHYTDFLVRYHCNVLHYIHGVFHISTFLRTHDEWISGLRKGRGGMQPYDFLSLYFAVLSCSLHFLDEQVASTELGMSKEAITTLPRLWADISINCLHLSQYIVRPTLPILQTICVLPMVAHSFGTSAYLFSLLHSGIDLAKELNIHLLADGSRYARSLGNVDREMCKRIWLCLDIAHCMKPNNQHSYALLYPASRTSLPANVDDEDLSDECPVPTHPKEIHTGISHVLAMGCFAKLFRDFNHDFNKETSLSSQFRCAKSYDTRLVSIMDSFPAQKPNEGEDYCQGGGGSDVREKFDHRPWSRFLFATLIPQCRIFLYRWFLSAGYSNSKYLEAREICLASARELTALRQKPLPILFQKNWHVSSNTIMAATVIATELLHGGHDEFTKVGLRAEVNSATNVLKLSKSSDAIVERGIEILEKMLEDEIAMSSSATMMADNVFWPGGAAGETFDQDLLSMLLRYE